MDASCACFKWRCASRFGGHRIEHGTLVDRISHQAQSLYRHFGTTPVHRTVIKVRASWKFFSEIVVARSQVGRRNIAQLGWQPTAVRPRKSHDWINTRSWRQSPAGSKRQRGNAAHSYMLGQFVGLRSDVFKIADSTSPLWTLRTSSDRTAGQVAPQAEAQPVFHNSIVS